MKLSISKGYLFIFFLVMISGTIVSRPLLEYLPLILFCFITLFYGVPGNFFFKKYFIYISILLIVFILQRIFLGYVSVLGSINFFLKIYIAAFLFYKLGNKFRQIYFNVIYFFSIVSIFFFTVFVVTGYPVSIIEYPNFHSIIIFNIKYDLNGAYIMRNCGPFWEPGAFVGYIIFALLLYIDDLKGVYKRNKFKFLTIILALITTFSTTGYIIILFWFIVMYLTKEKKQIIIWLFGFFIVTILVGYSIYKIPFLRDKITSQTEVALMSSDNNEFNGERLGALLFDLYYIKKHPLIGNGWHAKTRYADHPYLMEQELNGTIGNGNGFSTFLASMGIVFVLIYFYKINKTLPLTTKYRFIFITTLVLLYQGEQFLYYPLFISLPLLNIYRLYEKKNINSSIINLS